MEETGEAQAKAGVVVGAGEDRGCSAASGPGTGALKQRKGGHLGYAIFFFDRLRLQPYIFLGLKVKKGKGKKSPWSSGCKFGHASTEQTRV